MDLLLWRHAEAEDGTDNRPDAQRKLTAKGAQQAARMAAWIRRHAPKDLRILASPAVRCQQTAHALGLPFETDERLGVDGSASELLAAAGWPHDAAAKPAAALIVGHQPTLGRVAALLLSGKEDHYAIKKGALCWLCNMTKQGRNQFIVKLAVESAFQQNFEPSLFLRQQ